MRLRFAFALAVLCGALPAAAMKRDFSSALKRDFSSLLGKAQTGALSTVDIMVAAGLSDQELLSLPEQSWRAWPVALFRTGQLHECVEAMQSSKVTPQIKSPQAMVRRILMGPPFSWTFVLNSPDSLKQRFPEMVEPMLEQLAGQPKGHQLLAVLAGGIKSSNPLRKQEPPTVVVIGPRPDGVPEVADVPAYVEPSPTGGMQRQRDEITAGVGDAFVKVRLAPDLARTEIHAFTYELDEEVAPAFIVLGHELIHALHAAAGVSDGEFDPSAFAWTDREEERTIEGFGDARLLESLLTENALRVEHGLRKRRFHLGVIVRQTPPQHAKGGVSPSKAPVRKGGWVARSRPDRKDKAIMVDQVHKQRELNEEIRSRGRTPAHDEGRDGGR
jgi:hypothetical protein